MSLQLHFPSAFNFPLLYGRTINNFEQIEKKRKENVFLAQSFYA